MAGLIRWSGRVGLVEEEMDIKKNGWNIFTIPRKQISQNKIKTLSYNAEREEKTEKIKSWQREEWERDAREL